MSQQDKLDRFEELEAGRILGDLDAAESKEWQELSDEFDCGPDLSLELIAAALETDAAQEEALPAGIAELLRQEIPKHVSVEKDDTSIIRPSIWRRFVSSPQTGWAAAAIFAALFIGVLVNQSSPLKPIVKTAPELSSQAARDQLVGKARDLIESDFGGTDAYPKMSGKVVWSDSLQEGYMTLTDLPVNDPGDKQYQLWIVDPTRDEKPVDGGVFDIPAGDKTAVIPIRNPLAVTNPAAFVITLEQAGGVVVSKQEIVVALAKNS